MQRLSILTSPIFLGAIVLLAFNDHVLKQTVPGLITGKLSDFAGVIVVAIVLSVVVGRRWAVALTAIGFAALKTVPGVNLLAAPLLGGVTLADPSDVIGLAILWPLYHWLGRAAPELGDQKDGPVPRLVPRNLLAVPALAAALFATTATSCDTSGVNVLAAHEDTIYAGISFTPGADMTATEWFTSEDDGRTWERQSDPPPGSAVFSDTEVCAESDNCWRSAPTEGLEHCVGGSCTTTVDVDDLGVKEGSACSGEQVCSIPYSSNPVLTARQSSPWERAALLSGVARPGSLCQSWKNLSLIPRCPTSCRRSCCS
jgi:hypothetical protein